MSTNPAFDPANSAEKNFFAKFMKEVTPPSEIIALATNGAALVFRPVDANEFSKIEREAKGFIDMVRTGRGMREDWKPFQIRDAGLLFKLFFLWETMVGWHEKTKLVNASGVEIAPADEVPDGARYVPTGERLEKWEQKAWLWFASQAIVSYRAIETQALQGQAIGTDSQEWKAVSEAGEASSATS